MTFHKTLAISSLLIASTLTGCSFGGIPTDIQKQSTAAFLQCSDEMEKNQLDDAYETCQSGLNTLEKYDNRVKEGIYDRLTRIEARRGNYEAAEKYAKSYVELSARLEGKSSFYYAEALMNLGGIYGIQLKFQESEAFFAESKKIFDKETLKKKPSPGEYLEVLSGLAFSEIAQDKVADETLEQLLKAKGLASPTEYDIKMAHASLAAQIGDGYYAHGRLKEAEKLYVKSLNLYGEWSQKSPDAKNHAGKYIVAPYPSIVNGAKHLAEIYEKTDRPAEATKINKFVKDWSSLSLLDGFPKY